MAEVSLAERLQNGNILLLDGGMGTMLQSKGLTSSDCPEEWNVSHASVVLDIHRAYRDAGSMAIITNTFGGSPFKLGKYGFGDRTEEFNSAAARIAREAAGDDGFVLGDIGPTGEILEPYGEADSETLMAGFRRQVCGLLDGGVHGFIIETIMDFEELRVAVEAISAESDLPILCSMTFSVVPDGFRTMWGMDVETAAQSMAGLPVSAVGANCGLAPEQYAYLVAEMKAATDMPIIAEPNAGMPRLEGDQTVFDQTPEIFAESVKTVYEAGATILGGCCGTTPDHITAMRKILGL